MNRNKFVSNVVIVQTEYKSILSELQVINRCFKTRVFSFDLYVHLIMLLLCHYVRMFTPRTCSQRSNDWALAWTRAWFTHFRSLSLFIPQNSAARAISVLSSIILPLQTFFFRVLLLRQQPFWSENLPPERPTTTFAIKTQVVIFRYELVNSTRKFTIVAEIVSL